MSGAEDLARLTQTIDKTNELLLSPEVKMVDVGGGVMRPTNAMVMTNLATLLGGAMPYTSVEEGLAETADGTNFSVLSSELDLYVNVYRHAGDTAVFVDSYPNSKATRKASETADAAYSLSQPRSLADEMPFAVVDKDYRAILGVKANGAAHALLDQLPGLDLIGDYSWAVTDVNGVVLLGIKWSGEVVIYGQASGTVTAYVEGPIGGQDVWVLVDGVPFQITSSGDNFSPQVSSGRLTFIRRYGSSAPVTVDVPVSGTWAEFITTVLHIVGSGQSLAVGTGSPVVTTQPPTANRLFTIKDGVRLSNQDDTLTSDMVAPFIPLVGKAQETPVVQLSAQLNRNRGLPSNAGLLTSCHGRGGYTIAQLSKGSPTGRYANSMTAVTAAKAECTARGLGYKVPFIDWIQGEADRASAQGAYLASLLQLQADYDTDIKAVSGQGGVIPILLDQISNWSAYAGITESFVPLEQLQAALDYPTRFYCAGPKYWVPTNPEDGVHLPSMSSVRVGSMHARAAEAIINGSSWKPTHMVSAVRTGRVVRVQFYTPVAPLVIDSLNVTDPGNLGFRYVDSTASATIQSVAMVGPSTVDITLSANPTGTGAYIGLADIGLPNSNGGPTTGPRSCLRDSSPDKDAYGQPLYNWACHQRINITTP
ncbi:hypothetical protein HP546_09570 [Pseudomonas sp. CM25]|uniref:hypothetical protein n=1 Tax=Pseudomonas sp. CM25 TaxID=2738448 RepID=UPI00155401D9|nr:hypothetical protein [Pseudomonas sp. CM25]NQD55593.1 hypothetical protein [Pseudomonas sp. CM25]